VLHGQVGQQMSGGRTVQLATGDEIVLPIPVADDHVVLAVRNDQIDLVASRDSSELGTEHRLNATVSSVEYQGQVVRVDLDGFGDTELTAVVDEATFARSPLSPGDKVEARWPDSAMRVLHG